MTTALTAITTAIALIILTATAMVAALLLATHNWDSYSFNELRSMAKARNIKASRNWKRSDYIAALTKVYI